MLTKSIKFAMIFAVVLAFFSGTAMAGDRGRGGHHPTQWDRGNQKHHAYKWNKHYYKHHRGDRRYYAHHRRVDNHRKPLRAPYHQPERRVSKPHPLAPRIVFLGGLPVPVPPPPHEVLGYIAGHR